MSSFIPSHVGFGIPNGRVGWLSVLPTRRVVVSKIPGAVMSIRIGRLKES